MYFIAKFVIFTLFIITVTCRYPYIAICLSIVIYVYLKVFYDKSKQDIKCRIHCSVKVTKYVRNIHIMYIRDENNWLETSQVFPIFVSKV